jgi:predicted nucleic acid-binding protein
MAADAVLVDSDTLSELSRGRPRVVDRARHYLDLHGRLTISVISVFERLRGYHLALRAGKPFEPQLNQFRRLVASSRVLPVDLAISSTAAHIWAALPAHARSAIGDILIAATAVAYGLPLVTRNRRDFERMAALEGIDLKLVDWAR